MNFTLTGSIDHPRPLQPRGPGGGATAGPVSGRWCAAVTAALRGWTGPRVDPRAGPIAFDREIAVSRSLTTVRVGASLGVWSLTFLTRRFGDHPLPQAAS